MRLKYLRKAPGKVIAWNSTNLTHDVHTEHEKFAHTSSTSRLKTKEQSKPHPYSEYHKSLRKWNPKSAPHDRHIMWPHTHMRTHACPRARTQCDTGLLFSSCLLSFWTKNCTLSDSSAWTPHLFLLLQQNSSFYHRQFPSCLLWPHTLTTAPVSLVVLLSPWSRIPLILGSWTLPFISVLEPKLPNLLFERNTIISIYRWGNLTSKKG